MRSWCEIWRNQLVPTSEAHNFVFVTRSGRPRKGTPHYVYPTAWLDKIAHSPDLKDVVKSTAARSSPNTHCISVISRHEQARARHGDSRELQKLADAAGHCRVTGWQVGRGSGLGGCVSRGG
jgi:hypothetical protein